jgi:hypothetical protein
MTIVSVSIHAKLQAGISRVAQLTEQLSDESTYPLTAEQQGDIAAMTAGVEQFKAEMRNFPDLSTQTPQQLTTLRHDMRNHLNLMNGFAFVFVKGLGGELPAEKVAIAEQIHRLSKSLISIVNRIA